MLKPVDAKHLAKLAGVSTRELQKYRSRGLLDPDGDGQFDEMDVLRLRLLTHYRSLGRSIEDIEVAIKASSPSVMYADLLWALPDDVLSVEQAAESSGIPADVVGSLLLALGLGNTIPRSDVRFLEAVKGLVGGGIPARVVLEVARVYGDTMRRLGQTEVRMIREFMGEAGRSSVLKEREQSERLQAVQELMLPILEPLLLSIHRRHLLRASVQESLADLEAAEKGTERDALEATIVFVDLASFTSLARMHGDEVAADILDRFDALVRRLVEEHKGSLVKQIGDAFMLVFVDAGAALRFAVHLEAAVSRETNFPAVRTGINTGPVLYRVGDYIGNTVNVAARLAALASAHEILVTDTVIPSAAAAGIKVVSTGKHELAGVETPIELWRVDRPSAMAPERDPVCGMAVGDDAVARLRYDDVTYAFCSPACLRRFLEEPERYAVGADRAEKPEL